MKKYLSAASQSKRAKVAIVSAIILLLCLCIPLLSTFIATPSSQAVSLDEPASESQPKEAPPEGANATVTLQRAPVNPDFLDYLQNPLEPFYGYIPPPMDLSHLQEIPVQRPEPSALQLTQSLPEAFDWRETDNVTPVKDQSSCGTCWIFGTIAAVESRVLIVDNVSYDFSEQNVACCLNQCWVDYHTDRCHKGGNSFKATDVLSKQGARLESCDPYDTDNINTDSCNDSCTSIKMITGYRLVTDNQLDAGAIDAIKDAVYNYGPVSMAFYYNSSYMHNGSIYYYDGAMSANHLVCIVGWDDSIPHPEDGGSGAWIVKNSWGTGWEDSGYFYMSYYSTSMGHVGSYRYQDYDPGETLYYWDEAGWVGNAGYGTGNNSAWMASIFTSKQDGNLTYVDFWTTSNNAQYEIYVYNGSLYGNELANQSGTCNESGYYSILLNSSVSLTNGQQFTVAVNMTTPGYNYPIPVEYEDPDWCEPTIQSNVSFARPNASANWSDLADDGYNACLRAKVTSPTHTLTVNSTDGGNVSTPGETTFTYGEGTVVNLTATPDPCYTFVNWTGNVSTIADVNDSTTNITMNGNYTITANFADAGITYNLTTNSSDGGNMTTPGEGTLPYNCSEVVNINATPDSGYVFTLWTGNVSEIANVFAANTTITMFGNYSINANFLVETITYNLTVNSTDGGNVTTPGEETFPYNVSQHVNLVATADDCYTFVNWTGNTTTIGDVNAANTTVIMLGNYSINANFAALGPYNLTVNSTDGGNVSTPGEGTFPYNCSEVVNINTTPDPCYTFVNWTGNVSEIANAYTANTTITMLGNYSIIANFLVETITYNLTVNSTDGGNVSTPGEGTFPYNCSEVVNINATPDTCYTFVNWTGNTTTIGDVNATNTTVIMLGNYSINANFADAGITYSLTVAVSGNGSTSPAGGPHTYDCGDAVSLVATPDAGYEFVEWTGDTTTIANANAAHTTITMLGNYNITANFELGAPTPTPWPGPGGGGGGGWVPPPAPELEVNLCAEETSWDMSNEGVLLEDVHVTSADGEVTIHISDGTELLDPDGDPLDEMDVTPVDPPPTLPESSHVIAAFDFEPDGATFDPGIEITIAYDPDTLPEGLDEENLIIASHDEASEEWECVTSVVDTNANTVAASIGHFTVFAIIGIEETAFVFSNLSISPNMVNPGESVNISVQVTNTGGMEGSYMVTMLINGAEEQAEQVMLEPGVSDIVTFTVTRDIARTYAVEIGGLTDEFSVRAPFPWGLVGGIVGGVFGLLVIAAITVYFVVLRRKRAEAQLG